MSFKSKLIICLILLTSAFIVVLSVLAHAKEYSDEEIAQAIYLAEGGAVSKYPYGIRSVKCNSKDECKKICLKTIANNRKRFASDSKGFSDYLQFLASRYCPIGADNDPKGLNKNWLKNVRFFLKKGEKNG